MPDAATTHRPDRSSSFNGSARGQSGRSTGRREFIRPTVAAKTRKPTKQPAWPRILVSGEEGSRKSWTAALLSADERIAGMYWMEVGDGENTADEYGLIPGVKYEIIAHDGTWRDIMEQLAAHWQLAKDAEALGNGPIALSVDAMNGVHSMLSDMADTRARRRLAKQLAGRQLDPDMAWSSEEEAIIGPDLWNLVKKRHAEFMHYVLTWPGPVVLISAEDVATVFDANDKPTKEKTWTLRCRKDLPKQVAVHVRMFRGKAPEILKLKSGRPQISVDPAADTWRPQQVPGMTLAKLVFDVIGCDPKTSRAPETRVYDADQTMPDETPSGQVAEQLVEQFRVRLLAAKSSEDVRTLIVKMQRAELTGHELVTHEGKTGKIGALAARIETQLMQQEQAATAVLPEAAARLAQTPASPTTAPDEPGAGEVASQLTAVPAVDVPVLAGLDAVKPLQVAESCRDLPVTVEQLADLDRLFTVVPKDMANLEGRARRLFLTRELIGRAIERSTDMTQGEARDLSVDIINIAKKGDLAGFAQYFEQPTYQPSGTPVTVEQAGAHA